MTLALEESPPSRLRFRAVSGNMKRMQGHWQVSAAGGGVPLVYEAELAPDFWVPPFVGEFIMRRDISRQIEGVVAEMLKRYGAGSNRAVPGNDERVHAR